MLENIKSLCSQRKVSLLEVERSCGIAQRTIYRWDESTPSVDKVKLVADYFGVTVDDLLAEPERIQTSTD